MEQYHNIAAQEKTSPQAEIPAIISELFERFDLLDKSLAVLTEKFGPVIRDSAPSLAAPVPDRQTGTCTVHNQLLLLHDKLVRVNDTVRELTDRAAL